MFETVLRILGSDEQVEEYLPKMLSYEILGWYAQTELGHGSDIQGLQTEAIFDKQTDEFVVNTPTLTATKFWPGELGKQANFCVFHSKMIVDGQNYGVQAFIARIRDQDTHRPLRGLEIGDIGPKYGYSVKDNGYMIFKDFRVPRTALLSRYVSLTKEGKLNIQGDPKVAYSTMLFVRISLINFTWKLAISMWLLGIRYTLIRRQFKTISNSEEERRIFDYQATQYQIIPFLAYAYGWIFSSKQCVAKYNLMREEIKNDKFTTMRDLHSIASAFKALQMQQSIDGLFKIRECCGAHGYSNYSNLPNVIEIWSPNVTLEGDTMVMYQQTAKEFIKLFRMIENYGKETKGIYSYLNEYKDFIGAHDHTTQFKNTNDLLRLYKWATILSIVKVSKLLPDIDDELKFESEWNKVYQIEIISAARLNAHYLVASMFYEELTNKDLSAPLKVVLDKMLKLYLCDIITRYGEELLISSYSTSKQLSDIKDYIDQLISEIRPHAYKLTKSFLVDDILLHSKLSLTHGKVYEELYNTASCSKLNNKTMLDVSNSCIKPLSRKLKQYAKI